MYQQITVIGHLGRDPESKQSNSGKTYAQVSVAASRNLGNGNKETTWFVVTAWEKTGSYLVNYAKKGSLVVVVGRLNPGADGLPRAWIDKSGTPKSSFEITASEVRILSGFKTEDERNATPQPVQAKPKETYPRKTAQDLNNEDPELFY